MSFHSQISLKISIFLFAIASFSVQATARNMDDISQRRIIGFSASGDYFAFEEFGKNPGSGNAYANIYVINTVRNKWVKGSPFRVKPSEGLRSRRAVRNKVERKAKRMLKRLGIQRKRVRILAHNPITELNKNKMVVRVNPRISISEVKNPMIFSIDQFNIRKPAHCRRVRRRIKGLVIRIKRQGERAKQLHKDKRIPKSRGCPVGYTISDVIQLKKSGRRGAVYAVIYSIIRKGKYGMERRFIGGGYHDSGDRRDPDYYDDNNEYGDYDTPHYYNNNNQGSAENAGYRPNNNEDRYGNNENNGYDRGDRYNNGNRNSSSNNDNRYSSNNDDPNDRYSGNDYRDQDDRYNDSNGDTGYNYKRSRKNKNKDDQQRRR